MGNCLGLGRKRNDDGEQELMNEENEPQRRTLLQNSTIGIERGAVDENHEENGDYYENTVFNIGDEPVNNFSQGILTLHPQTSSQHPETASEEQIKRAQRLGFLHHLPTGIFDGSKKSRECVICMMEFSVGERIRYLPCLHTFHQECIDDWLMRSFTCPSCVEAVDAALISTFFTSE